jgi:hypothetical protein
MSLIGGGLLCLLLQPVSLYAFDISDFGTWEFTASPTATQTATAAAKNLLPKVVGSSNEIAIKLGFAGVGDFINQSSNLNVAPPYPVFHIGLDRLRNFDWQHQQDPRSLLLDEPNFLRWSSPSPAWFLFPITVNATVRSSVLIAMTATDRGWKIRQIGSSEKIVELAKHGVAPKYFVVEIPAMNRYYLGNIDKATFTIKYAIGDPFHNEGTEEPAGDVFTRLQLEAVKVYADQMPR